MSNWVIINSSNELLHSAKGTTWEKKDHKYISKEKKNGRTYYKYDKKTDMYEEIELSPEEEKEALTPGTALEKINYEINKLNAGKEWADKIVLEEKGLYRRDTILEKTIITDDKIKKKK